MLGWYGHRAVRCRFYGLPETSDGRQGQVPRSRPERCHQSGRSVIAGGNPSTAAQRQVDCTLSVLQQGASKGCKRQFWIRVMPSRRPLWLPMPTSSTSWSCR